METDGGHVTFGYTTHACVFLSLNTSTLAIVFGYVYLLYLQGFLLFVNMLPRFFIAIRRTKNYSIFLNTRLVLIEFSINQSKADSHFDSSYKSKSVNIIMRVAFAASFQSPS